MYEDRTIARPGSAQGISGTKSTYENFGEFATSVKNEEEPEARELLESIETDTLRGLRGPCSRGRNDRWGLSSR
jgi:hypothetical protein